MKGDLAGARWATGEAPTGEVARRERLGIERGGGGHAGRVRRPGEARRPRRRVTSSPGVSPMGGPMSTTYRVNDPDPRPDRTDATPCCDAIDPDGWGFICTMEPGH